MRGKGSKFAGLQKWVKIENWTVNWNFWIIVKIEGVGIDVWILGKRE